MLEIGQTAPEFSLPDQTGSEVKLSQFKGKRLFLYFYPDDNTPGCTTEACAIRDAWQDFKNADIVVVGVSADSIKKHQNFVTKYSLPFTLLSDKEKTVIKMYDAWGEKLMFGKKFEGILRSSYLIDPSSKIRKVYPKVDPEKHAREILEDFQDLTKQV